MQPKVADTISPEIDMEHIKCCISTCCARKFVYHFTKYLKQKTKSMLRFITI